MINIICWYFRHLFFYIGIIPITMIVCTIGWICVPLPDIYRYYIITSWSYFFIWWSKINFNLKYNVIGKENIPDKPCIVLCNHQSTWETIFMQVLLPLQTWIIKRELLYIPFFGWGLALIKPIAINRANKLSINNILKIGAQRIKEGRYIILYPEGTRMLPNQEKQYSRTGAALAIASHSIILPIAHNAGNFWPRGLFIQKSGTITIQIGNPIKVVDNMTSSTITKTVQTWINKTKSNMHPKG